ncbi:hypothetical protein ACHMW5_02385 [Azospirillum melinis]
MEPLPAITVTEPRPCFLGAPIPFRAVLLASTTPLWVVRMRREG